METVIIIPLIGIFFWIVDVVNRYNKKQDDIKLTWQKCDWCRKPINPRSSLKIKSPYKALYCDEICQKNRSNYLTQKKKDLENELPF